MRRKESKKMCYVKLQGISTKSTCSYYSTLNYEPVKLVKTQPVEKVLIIFASYLRCYQAVSVQY